MDNSFRNEVLKLVETAINEFNATQGTEVSRLIFDEETVLFGSGSQLKSVDLVRLIVDIEFKLEMAFGIGDALSNEKAMSQKNSPFRTVFSLVNYICALEHGK